MFGGAEDWSESTSLGVQARSEALSERERGESDCLSLFFSLFVFDGVASDFLRLARSKPNKIHFLSLVIFLSGGVDFFFF